MHRCPRASAAPATDGAAAVIVGTRPKCGAQARTSADSSGSHPYTVIPYPAGAGSGPVRPGVVGAVWLQVMPGVNASARCRRVSGSRYADDRPVGPPVDDLG